LKSCNLVILQLNNRSIIINHQNTKSPKGREKSKTKAIESPRLLAGLPAVGM
jgi:hypothetical protein